MERDIDYLFSDERIKNTDKDLLRQAQLIDLRTLRIIDYICNKNNINYWLDSGTLLGAVRHGGFIPWDDDIDIAMTREDYEKFIRIAEDELPGSLFMQNFETTPYASNTWTQIKDRKSIIVLEKDAEYHQGIYIDVFPMDCYSVNKFKRFFSEQLLDYLYVYSYAVNAPLKKPLASGLNFKNNLIKILLKIIFFPFLIFNKKVIYNINIKTREKRINRLKKNPRVIYGYGADVLNYNQIYKEEYIFPLKKISFEGYEFNAPNDYDAYLTVLYGNYMQLPPESRRVYHNKSIRTILTEEEIIHNNMNFSNKISK